MDGGVEVRVLLGSSDASNQRVKSERCSALYADGAPVFVPRLCGRRSAMNQIDKNQGQVVYLVVAWAILLQLVLYLMQP
jgi:hypothetical protein